MDVVVFGHHIPTYKTIDDIIFINPGSLHIQGKSDKSFGVLTIDNNISYEEIKYKINNNYITRSVEIKATLVNKKLI